MIEFVCLVPLAARRPHPKGDFDEVVLRSWRCISTMPSGQPTPSETQRHTLITETCPAYQTLRFEL